MRAISGVIQLIAVAGFSRMQGTNQRWAARASRSVARIVALPAASFSRPFGSFHAAGKPHTNSLVLSAGCRARDQVVHGNPIHIPRTTPEAIHPNRVSSTAGCVISNSGPLAKSNFMHVCGACAANLLANLPLPAKSSKNACARPLWRRASCRCRRSAAFTTAAGARAPARHVSPPMRSACSAATCRGGCPGAARGPRSLQARG